MKHLFIEANKLEISSQNVRRHAAKAAAADLKASILAHGLLQNLVVIAAAGGRYRVIAGGRRLLAIRALQKERLLPKDYAVPCQIAGEKQAAEMSLAENIVRLAMHPADEFEAFARLIDGGNSGEQVAQRFGVSVRHVEQRLKLGKLATRLLKAYRAEKLTLDCLMAFTVTDDHARQLEAYEALADWHGARQIREMLTGGLAKASDKLAIFVGLDAYHATGGQSRGDLFGEEIYLENPELLHRLAGEKLEAIRRQLELEGWKWVEIEPDCDWPALSRYGRIQPDAKSGDFDPQQMAWAGCHVAIGGSGELCIRKGLVRGEDRKRLIPEATDRPQIARGGMPFTLIRELEASRQQAVQVEIARNRLVALDLLAFTAASSVFGAPAQTGLDVDFRERQPATGEATPAGHALDAIRQGLPLAWAQQSTEAARFAAFRQLGEAEKLDLLAYCTACSLKPQLGSRDEITALELFLSLTGGNMAGYWRPTRANFLGRIPRDQLLGLGGELLGEQWAQSRSRDTKAALAEQLQRVFAEPEQYARQPGQLETLQKWLPDGMAFGTDPIPTPAKGKARKAA